VNIRVFAGSRRPNEIARKTCEADFPGKPKSCLWKLDRNGPYSACKP
jgi:hypothetical protein